MSFKDRTNGALRRLTGYSLTKQTPEEADAERRRLVAEHQAAQRRLRKTVTEEVTQRERKRARLAAERARERRQQQREERRTERLAARARGEHWPYYYDADKRRILLHVSEWTMTGREKLNPLIDATRYVARHGIPGDVVECGVWRGGSMQAMAMTLMAAGDTSRELHLFDTFEGMPPPTEADGRTRGEAVISASELLETHERDTLMWAVATLDDVKKGMAGTGYPEDKIHYHPGLVEETTPAQAPDQIAILRLDTDWYTSTKHELEHLYTRLSPGGILMLDDYNSWDGAKLAVDEWLEESGIPIFMMPMGPGLIAVKPY